MKTYSRIVALSSIVFATITPTAFSTVTQVRVVNETPKIVYIHPGRAPLSVKIAPGKYHIFHYPFKTPKTGMKTSILVATAGGHWQIANDNLTTTLKDPSLMLCIDYANDELKNKTGNRKWVIHSLNGFDKGCSVKPYQQPLALQG